MKDCEHLLEEIADRQKQIFDILVFFKVVVIVVLSLIGVAFVLSLIFWISLFAALSSLATVIP